MTNHVDGIAITESEKISFDEFCFLKKNQKILKYNPVGKNLDYYKYCEKIMN